MPGTAPVLTSTGPRRGCAAGHFRAVASPSLQLRLSLSLVRLRPHSDVLCRPEVTSPAEGPRVASLSDLACHRRLAAWRPARPCAPPRCSRGRRVTVSDSNLV